MNRLILTFLQVYFVVGLAQSQHEQIRQEILEYEDQNYELITKGRKLLLLKFLDFDKNKVDEITSFLISIEKESDYLAFYPAEKWLLFYWNQKYLSVIESVLSYTQTYEESDYKIRPPDDFLGMKLVGHLREQRINIRNQIDNSDLSSEEKDFLFLNFLYIISDPFDTTISQDSINVAGKRFLSLYPESRFKQYIRSYFHPEFIHSKWGWGLEFFSGYGIFTDQLKMSFKSNVPFGVAFDISYKKFTLFIRNYIGFSRTQDSIPFREGVWKKNAEARVFLPEATLGYVMLDSRRLKLTPFAGIASTSISPVNSDINKYPEYADIELAFTTTYSLGMNMDWKLGRGKSKPTGVNEHSYGFIRLRYAYNQPRFFERYNRFDGDFHYITLGIGAFLRSYKRII